MFYLICKYYKYISIFLTASTLSNILTNNALKLNMKDAISMENFSIKQVSFVGKSDAG